MTVQVANIRKQKKKKFFFTDLPDQYPESQQTTPAASSAETMPRPNPMPAKIVNGRNITLDNFMSRSLIHLWRIAEATPSPVIVNNSLSLPVGSIHVSKSDRLPADFLDISKMDEILVEPDEIAEPPAIDESDEPEPPEPFEYFSFDEQTVQVEPAEISDESDSETNNRYKRRRAKSFNGPNKKKVKHKFIRINPIPLNSFIEVHGDYFHEDLAPLDSEEEGAIEIVQPDPVTLVNSPQAPPVEKAVENNDPIENILNSIDHAHISEVDNRELENLFQETNVKSEQASNWIMDDELILISDVESNDGESIETVQAHDETLKTTIVDVDSESSENNLAQNTTNFSDSNTLNEKESSSDVSLSSDILEENDLECIPSADELAVNAEQNDLESSDMELDECETSAVVQVNECETPLVQIIECESTATVQTAVDCDLTSPECTPATEITQEADVFIINTEEALVTESINEAEVVAVTESSPTFIQKVTENIPSAPVECSNSQVSIIDALSIHPSLAELKLCEKQFCSFFLHGNAAFLPFISRICNQTPDYQDTEGIPLALLSKLDLLIECLTNYKEEWCNCIWKSELHSSHDMYVSLLVKPKEFDNSPFYARGAYQEFQSNGVSVGVLVSWDLGKYDVELISRIADILRESLPSSLSKIEKRQFLEFLSRKDVGLLVTFRK